MLKAIDGVAKSNGGGVRGTWLQLMCCALPKCCVPNLPQGQGWRLVRGCWSWVGIAILETGEGRVSWGRQ